MNYSDYFVILGAPDHEMREIERLCKRYDIPRAWARTPTGKIVKSHEAYCAVDLSKRVPTGCKIVTVECAVLGLNPDVQIDHHNPGDAGYGMPPEQYFQGSSLGQFLTFFGIEPTPEQHIIAAADHCLAAAYQGMCPGIDVSKLRAWREASRSKARKLSVEELVSQINVAISQLVSAEKISIEGTTIAFIEEPGPEVSEASARIGMPYCYLAQQDDGRTKAGIRSAPANVVKAWLDRCELKAVYGDPARGFAGGYF